MACIAASFVTYMYTGEIDVRMDLCGLTSVQIVSMSSLQKKSKQERGAKREQDRLRDKERKREGVMRGWWTD